MQPLRRFAPDRRRAGWPSCGPAAREGSAAVNHAFRFLHASDFHLDRPPRGLAEVPDHLRRALVDAPYRAAERVFDAALKERVDVVVLAGDLVDPLAAGPRGLVFLAEQFQRVGQRGIKVYWSLGGSDDLDRIGDLGSLGDLGLAGDHLVRFPSHRVERVVHFRQGEPIAQILGSSSRERRKIRAADFRTDGTPLFALAVAYGSVDPETLGHSAVSFWALGGQHARRAVLTGPISAHYAGSPQGRRPAESGPHGCTLVDVDETYHVRTSFIPTDSVRYQPERVTVDESATLGQLHEVINQRIVELAGDPFGPDLLIDWTIAGSKTLAAALRQGKAAADLVARLRAEHGQLRPAAWTFSLEPDAPADVPAEHYDEETALGEFLRTVQHYVEHADDPLDLEPFLAQRHASGHLGAAVALDDVDQRRRVLAEVAHLGVELLGPQESRP